MSKNNNKAAEAEAVKAAEAEAVKAAEAEAVKAAEAEAVKGLFVSDNHCVTSPAGLLRPGQKVDEGVLDDEVVKNLVKKGMLVIKK